MKINRSVLAGSLSAGAVVAIVASLNLASTSPQTANENRESQSTSAEPSRFDFGVSNQYRAEGPSDGIEQFPSIAVSMTAAPTSLLSEAVPVDQALMAVSTDGLRVDVQSAIKPVATLKLYSKSRPSLTSNVPVRNLLVWDVVYPDAPQRIHTPSDFKGEIQANPCDLHVIVDALTGTVMEGFQTECTLR